MSISLTSRAAPPGPASPGRTCGVAVRVLSWTLGLAALPARAEGAVEFRIQRGGDVTWMSAPCTATVIERIDNEDGAVTTVELSGPVPLAAGRYEAVVGCPSDEGRVARTVSFAVPRAGPPVKVPVALEPGFLLVKVLRYDTPVVAEIAVFDERGREVASSKDKAIIPVVPGRVRVVARVQTKKHADRPVVGNASAVVVARKKVPVTVDTTDGELVVTLTDNGRKTGGVAALREPGQQTRLVELRAGDKEAVPPGTYELVTQVEGTHDLAEVVTKDLVIVPGKTTARTVAHRTGTLRATVVVDGRRGDASAPVELQYFRPGAEVPFSSGKVGETLHLGPGTIEVRARRTDGGRDDGSSAEARARVTVPAGGAASVTLELASATIDVVTQVGGVPRSLDVEVFPGGTDVAVARATTDAEGRARLSVAPGKVRVRGVLRTPQGDVATEKALVATGKAQLTLNLVVGTAVVQVFEDGVAVPAEVRFFAAPRVRREVAQAEDSLPSGTAMFAVPAGQEAVLEPGTYAVTVKRKGVERRTSDLKVAAGRVVERTVELKVEPAAAEKTRERPRLE